MNKKSVRKLISPKGGAGAPIPGPGRPKGSVNKFTTLKQSFLNVFERMGGDDALLEFAKTHKAVFYQMITRLFPQDIAHTGEVAHTVQFIMPRPAAKDDKQ